MHVSYSPLYVEETEVLKGWTICPDSPANMLQRHNVNQFLPLLLKLLKVKSKYCLEAKREREKRRREQKRRELGQEKMDVWRVGKNITQSNANSLTRFSTLYNLIYSSIWWKLLVVNLWNCQQSLHFESWVEHTRLLGLGMRVGKRSKWEKTFRKHISLTACRRKLFTTGKCKPLLPTLDHGDFTSLIIAVRVLSVNSKLLTYKISSVFHGKAKGGNGKIYKSSK